MKLLSIKKHTYDEGYHYNMESSGVTIIPEDIIVNINEISSLQPWEGRGLMKGRHGTKITMTNGNYFIDHRKKSEILNLITHQIKYYV